MAVFPTTPCYEEFLEIRDVDTHNHINKSEFLSNQSAMVLLKDLGACEVDEDKHGNKLYRATDVGRLLGMANIRKTIHTWDVPEFREIKVSLTRGGPQKVVFLTTCGLRRLLATSRSLVADRIATELGMDIMPSLRVSCKESTTLAPLLRAFAGAKMLPQYKVGNFYVDLYFPEYKIAVECDEHGSHSRSSDQEYDKQRQIYIEDALQCTFVRYRPDDSHFDIFTVINTIWRLIARTTVESKGNTA